MHLAGLIPLVRLPSDHPSRLDECFAVLLFPQELWNLIAPSTDHSASTSCMGSQAHMSIVFQSARPPTLADSISNPLGIEYGYYYSMTAYA